MEHPEYDMEVTPERAEFIKQHLLRLYADQIGVKVNDLIVTVLPPGSVTPDKEPA